MLVESAVWAPPLPGAIATTRRSSPASAFMGDSVIVLPVVVATCVQPDRSRRSTWYSAAFGRAIHVSECVTGQVVRGKGHGAPQGTGAGWTTCGTVTVVAPELSRRLVAKRTPRFGVVRCAG